MIIADENIEAEVVAKLRSDGHTVEYVAESFRGANDEVILDRAEQLGAVLLTGDKDFGELVHRGNQAHHGVVLVRIPDHVPAADKADIVAAAFRKHGDELLGAFSVISPSSIRIRRS